MIKAFNLSLAVLLSLTIFSCKQTDDPAVSHSQNSDKLSAKDAVEFIRESEETLTELLQENERMAWVYSNFITEDTEQLAAIANKKFTAMQVELAVEAAKYYEIEALDADSKRKLNILRSGITIPAPRDVAKTAEQSDIGAKLGGMYGKGEYCYADGR